MTKQEALKTYFGYDTFRSGQEPLVDGILAGRDAFGVMPTGAGKSLCFQLPALLLPGVTLVVSPLISLMRDQVTSLCASGVAAAYLNSSLTPGQYRKAVLNLQAGCYKIIYVAPERLLTEQFQDAIRGLCVSLLAVDEAHCISQWGTDFRPEYAQIPAFVQQLARRPVVAAFTATATQRVKDDIERLLHLQDPLRFSSSFDRPNLYFEVRQPRSKRQELLACVEKHAGESGIVYCSTRKAVEEACDFLRENGCAATRYHAGLSQAERQENQEKFLFDECGVMVATNAFGMGIDKSNVRYVVHYNMPLDMESYYQEAGRAGRDGELADCTLLYSGQDVITGKFLLQHGNEAQEQENAGESARALQLAEARLEQMARYCTTPRCLRQAMLGYFGEKTPAHCGNCGNCCDSQAVDVTAQARTALRCVESTGERFGITVLTAVLCGAEHASIARWHLEENPGFGALSGSPQTQVKALLSALVAQDYLAPEGEYRVLTLTPAGYAVLDGDAQVKMRAAQAARPSEKSKKEVGPRRAADLPPEDLPLFERLRTLRATLAKRRGVPAFVVFADSALVDMCRRKPQTLAQFGEVSGVGAKKCSEYGAEFLAEIAAFTAL